MDKQLLEQEAKDYANKTCLFKKNDTDAYYDVSINARQEAYIAGATQSSTVKELEREATNYKELYEQGISIINEMEKQSDTAEREVERLKGLVARMYNEFIRAAENTSPAVSENNWQQFKTKNNL